MKDDCKMHGIYMCRVDVIMVTDLLPDSTMVYDREATQKYGSFNLKTLSSASGI